MSSGTPKISAPARYVDWINHNLGCNPRGQRHSNALSAFMLDDLRALSPRLDADIDSGVVVAETNADVHTRIAFRNVDLVVSDPLQPGPLHQGRTAIEHKTVMTAHGKARKNRFGDISAYVNHVHNHNLHAIAAATVIVNTSMTYLNPDEWAKGITRPQLSAVNWQKLLTQTIGLFTSIPLREHPDDHPKDQPEALAVMLIEYDGRTFARLVTDPAAPQPGDAAHVLEFYRRIIRLYEQRFY
jgi:hypothetical protein